MVTPSLRLVQGSITTVRHTLYIQGPLHRLTVRCVGQACVFVRILALRLFCASLARIERCHSLPSLSLSTIKALKDRFRLGCLTISRLWHVTDIQTEPTKLAVRTYLPMPGRRRVGRGNLSIFLHSTARENFKLMTNGSLTIPIAQMTLPLATQIAYLNELCKPGIV